MKTKQEIVENWLPRYTERKLEDFTQHILLTNFTNYVQIFANHYGVPVLCENGHMPNAAADGITIINFGMGSSNAATIMDLLSAIMPKSVLFLGKCGGLKKVNNLGDYLLPIAAIRGEGTSIIIFRRKYRHYPHSLCLEPFHQPFAIEAKIIGQAPFIPPIEGFGNTMPTSKIIWLQHMRLE